MECLNQILHALSIDRSCKENVEGINLDLKLGVIELLRVKEVSSDYMTFALFREGR